MAESGVLLRYPLHRFTLLIGHEYTEFRRVDGTIVHRSVDPGIRDSMSHSKGVSQGDNDDPSAYMFPPAKDVLLSVAISPCSTRWPRS